jgi:hypothetical protein
MVIEIEVVLIVLALGWILSGFAGSSDHWLTRVHLDDPERSPGSTR